MSDQIMIAVSKGRIFEDALPLLKKLDICPLEDQLNSRKLNLETNQANIRIIVVRAIDVPIYVERGAVDIGFVGKDILMEYGNHDLYSPIDLGIARCRLVLAGTKQQAQLSSKCRPKVATKYVNISRNYFADRGQQVDIIKLYGSMEIAPALGLADWIVDLVDTGNTLKANGLYPIETICEISSRLVVNKASMKIKHSLLNPLFTNIQNHVCAPSS